MLNRFLNFYKKNPATAVKRVAAAIEREMLRHPSAKGLLNIIKPKVVPQKWIFLVGNYNSGTTILRDIIAAHPNVASLPTEAARYSDVFKRGDELGWARNWVECRTEVQLPAEQQPKVVAKFLNDLSPVWKNREADFFLEKTISNIERMEWIEKNLPNVRFIGFIRNGYASAEGMRRKAKPTGNAAKQYGKANYDMSMTGKQWAIANEALLENSKKVKHFKLFRYEELVADPQSVLTEMLVHAGLDPSPAQFDGGKISIGSKEFSLKNMNERSFKALSKDDISAFNAVAGDMMRTLKYNLIDA